MGRDLGKLCADVFQNKNSASESRQRWLALDLGDTPDAVPVGKIAELTPRLAKAYAAKTPKTLQRDLGALEKLGLIERTPKGVRAKREIILAFLPWRNQAAAREKK